MTRTRTRTGWTAAVVAAVTLAGCTTSSPAARPGQSPSASSTAARRDASEHMVRLLDVFFATEAATTNQGLHRRALLVSVDGRFVVERYWQSSPTTRGIIACIATA